MARGHVSNLRDTYGFVRSETNEDLFFLPTAVLLPDRFGDLKVGKRVEFDKVENPKDPTKFRAANLKIVKDAEQN